MAKPDFAVQQPASPRKGRKYFTVDEARRALPLVKRIAADVQATQALRIRLHSELTTGGSMMPAEKGRVLQSELELQTNRLEGLLEELGRIGVELKDPARALLDFPAWHEGREILLCWKGDEATITHWHEMDTGFVGRRPIEEILPVTATNAGPGTVGQ